MWQIWAVNFLNKSELLIKNHVKVSHLKNSHLTSDFPKLRNFGEWLSPSGSYKRSHAALLLHILRTAKKQQQQEEWTLVDEFDYSVYKEFN